MTRNNGTLDDYSCSNALLLPIINEFTWPVEVRAFLYLVGLLYCFTGVAIIAGTYNCIHIHVYIMLFCSLTKIKINP